MAVAFGRVIGARYGAQLLKQQLGVSSVPVRCLNLQEFQSKALMDTAGVSVQKFKVAESAAEAEAIAKELKFPEYVVKAQILAGGRGKGVFSNGFKGGVHLTKDPAAIAPMVDSMIGHNLTTKQTPKGGVTVNKVMVCEALDIERETYLAILMDRDHNGPVLVGSPDGGMDIEEVAATHPERIFKVPIDISLGLSDEQAMEMAKNLNFAGSKQRSAAEEIKKLYQLFLKVDATQIEINPLGETKDGRVVCFDAKINFDDNAEFRQPDIFAMEDLSETDPREIEAAKNGLSYIQMDGNIGCLVNGAGLAMATMDIVKLHGGDPANFLDCGGSVTPEQARHAFRLLSSDKQVKAILVNIFGGIVNCDIVADGIVKACKALSLDIPMVVRLEGTNVEAAKKTLSESGIAYTSANTLEEAAQKVVACLN